MAKDLQERIKQIRDERLSSGRQSVPDNYHGVTKPRIQSVLKRLDLDSRDIIDAVFALLDDEDASWFSAAPRELKFCDGATTAHIGSHVGILQRGSAIKLDREGRDYWVKPLRELGAIEPIYFHPGTKSFIPGHPISKSPNSAYRLAEDFKSILCANENEWAQMLNKWIREENVRQRLELQAQLAAESQRLVDTKHRDLIRVCIDYYLPHFLPDYQVIYVDEGDADRITQKDKERLAKAGIEISLADSMPDILLWNKKTEGLWVIEAVTSDGEVDEHEVTQLSQFATRNNKSSIQFTTAYQTWKSAASRQGKNKNIAAGTYIWIQEDGSKHYLSESFTSSPVAGSTSSTN